jgi:hypothetical protein
LLTLIPAPENEQIQTKDSVYTAIGLAAPVLHQQLDFDSFITKTLVIEVQKQGPGYSILRRRIAILLSQWISVKVSDASRPIVYQIFQHLLDRSDPTNDIVVRITAGREFKNVADEWEFKAEHFQPYAHDILARLMSLIEEASLSDSKFNILNTVSVIVQRLEHFVRVLTLNCITFSNLFRSHRMLIVLSAFYHHFGSNQAKNI